MILEYPLLDRRWISVLRDERPELISLHGLLAEAHLLHDLDWADPLEASAVLGLAVTYVKDACALHSRERWQEVWRAGRFPEGDLTAYAEANAGAFDLFAKDRPFGQVPGLEPVSGGPKPISLVVASAATGNNVPLFSTAAEDHVEPLGPGAAARRLVATLAWDTAAIKTGAKGDPQVKGGKTTGNPTGPMGQLGSVTLLADNLFRTIMLNVPIRSDAADRPAWRAEARSAGWVSRAPLGPMDLYTWPSRSIRLFPEERDGEVVVSRVLVCAGDRVATWSPEVEFRTGWRRGDDKTGSVLRPRRLQPGRAAWRGLAAQLTGADGASSEAAPRAGVLDQLTWLRNHGVVPDDLSVSLQLVGVSYGNQSAVIEDVMSDRTPLPVAALDPDFDFDLLAWIQVMTDQADAVARALNDLADNLRRAVGGDKTPWDKGQRPGERFVAAVGPEAQRVLAGLSREPERLDEVKLVWEQVLRRHAMTLAEPLISEVLPAAFLGHSTDGSDGHMIRQQNAEAYFHAALNKTLPASRPQPTTSHDKEQS